MELRVDLSDRLDIEAAHALLGSLLDLPTEATTGYPNPATWRKNLPDLDLPGTQDGALPTPPSELMGGNDPQGSEQPDPAAVAQSIAGAGALPTVPAALLGGVPNDPTGGIPPAPAAPPVAAAPAAPGATPPAPATLDKEGIPWDARINSNPPSMNKDGTWRKKKGLNDEAFINGIKAELKAVQAIPAGNAQAVSNGVAGAQTTASVSSSTTVPVVPTAPPVQAATPVAPPAPSAPPVVPLADPTTFQELMPRITGANAAGILPQAALLDACVAYQLTSIPALAQRPDLVPYVWALLKQSYPALV